MAHAQKPDFVFRRKGRVHLNRRERQFSRLLASEVCASAVVMLDKPSYEVVWRVRVTHSIRQFPLHFPSRASPCAIMFHLDSTHRAFVDCYMFGTEPLELSGVSMDLWSLTRAWLLQLRETPKFLELFLSFLPVTNLNAVKWRWKRSWHAKHEQLSGWEETNMKQDRQCTYNAILWRVPAIVTPPRLS
jgi:hypothetical protein